MFGRIRTHKPELATHPLLRQIGALLGWNMRWYYCMLFCYVDREGRFEWKPRDLKHEIEPDLAIDFEHVLNALANAGLIVKYRVGARVYGWVPRFLDHQSINNRESASTLPIPPVDVTAIAERQQLQADFFTFGANAEQSIRDALLCEPVCAISGVSSAADVTSTREARVPDASLTRDPRVTHAEFSSVLSSNTHSTEQGGVQATSGKRARAKKKATLLADVATESSGGRSSSTNGGHASTDVTLRAFDDAGAEITGVIVVDDPQHAQLVAALPPVHGLRTASAIEQRMATVFAEIADGRRQHLKREQLLTLEAEIVFRYWCARFDHPNALLDAKREARIKARLKENDSNVGEILYALDGAYHDEFIMGRGEHAGKKVHDAIETVLRDRGQIERFANTRTSYKKGVTHKALAKFAAALTGSSPPEQGGTPNERHDARNDDAAPQATDGGSPDAR